MDCISCRSNPATYHKWSIRLECVRSCTRERISIYKGSERTDLRPHYRCIQPCHDTGRQVPEEVRAPQNRRLRCRTVRWRVSVGLTGRRKLPAYPAFPRGAHRNWYRICVYLPADRWNAVVPGKEGPGDRCIGSRIWRGRGCPQFGGQLSAAATEYLYPRRIPHSRDRTGLAGLCRRSAAQHAGSSARKSCYIQRRFEGYSLLSRVSDSGIGDVRWNICGIADCGKPETAAAVY